MKLKTGVLTKPNIIKEYLYAKDQQIYSLVWGVEDKWLTQQYINFSYLERN
jgi:hypothetical protein